MIKNKKNEKEKKLDKDLKKTFSQWEKEKENNSLNPQITNKKKINIKNILKALIMNLKKNIIRKNPL